VHDALIRVKEGEKTHVSISWQERSAISQSPSRFRSRPTSSRRNHPRRSHWSQTYHHDRFAGVLVDLRGTQVPCPRCCLPPWLTKQQQRMHTGRSHLMGTRTKARTSAATALPKTMRVRVEPSSSHLHCRSPQSPSGPSTCWLWPAKSYARVTQRQIRQGCGLFAGGGSADYVSIVT
jgi:hypothetical protein